MPRVIKHPDVRRSEILDWAQRGFLSRGCDNASLNDEVIAEAGVLGKCQENRRDNIYTVGIRPAGV